VKNNIYKIIPVGKNNVLWMYNNIQTDKIVSVNAPVFEIDGKVVSFENVDFGQETESRVLRNGVVEYQLSGTVQKQKDLLLKIIFRIAPDNPILRFCYVLESTSEHHLTKTTGSDRLKYLSVNLKDYHSKTDIHFSEFNASSYSYNLVEHDLPDSYFENELTAMGPILIASNDDSSLLIAYEHGSQVLDEYINFKLKQCMDIELNAVKGNYWDGYILDNNNDFTSVWFEIGMVNGNADVLASHYRTFVLKYMSENMMSREPYIFYNTWNFQERNKWWNKKNYLSGMTEERMIKEIEIASQIGIDVFVIDTGWYSKTGDWQVSKERFPGQLKNIKKMLNDKGMKLGLWFSPQAAVTSDMFLENQECCCTVNGEDPKAHPVWETEESFQMCYVSKYWECFADKMISLYHELGVTYFKWDAISQRTCSDNRHYHGNSSNSLQECDDSQAFEQVRYLCKIVDKICAACPDAIVDFDITEPHRSVGLAFLAAGKFFLINNGPYYSSLGDPSYAPGGGMGANVFVFPGAARARVCREPLGYDKWIPSVLFLTHYLPDDPIISQTINMGSLILGQNGIWGDLLTISHDGIQYMNLFLSKYKQVKYDITNSTAVRVGIVSGSPEVHEKIYKNGKGVVVLFAEAQGQYSYITQNKVDSDFWATEGVDVTMKDNHAVIKTCFEMPGAQIVFFGVK
jgi:alpha-galactosidase